MRILKALLLGMLAVALAIPLWGFSINGAAPASTGAMTPFSPGTSTPIAVATCNNSRTNFRIDNKGSANCYMAPASASSPCAVASPAPNAGTGAGIWIAPNSPWIFNVNGIYSGFNNQAGAEWDLVCDAAGAKIYFVDLP